MKLAFPEQCHEDRNFYEFMFNQIHCVKENKEGEYSCEYSPSLFSPHQRFRR
jgi:hypothetical protein